MLPRHTRRATVSPTTPYLEHRTNRSQPMLCPFRSPHLNPSNSRYTALLLVCFSMLLASSASAQKWNRYGPGTRSQASSIYDPSTKQMIMFGGQHAPTNVDFHDVWAVKN